MQANASCRALAAPQRAGKTSRFPQATTREAAFLLGQTNKKMRFTKKGKRILYDGC